jgi:hypothetical protein
VTNKRTDFKKLQERQPII